MNVSATIYAEEATPRTKCAREGGAMSIELLLSKCRKIFAVLKGRSDGAPHALTQGHEWALLSFFLVSWGLPLRHHDRWK